MQVIFEQLNQLKDVKQELRHCCLANGIKISFTLKMSYSKSRNIFRKLQGSYQRGVHNLRPRWLDNELKLFHFALVAVSALSHIPILQFGKQQWKLLQNAFPNKLQYVLQYEAINFITPNSIVKKKWEVEEDNILAKIVATKDEELKWNQVAIDLFTESDKQFFRNAKQCRERWLNHLDQAVKHDKWSVEQDKSLMKAVLEHGKKWSQIMISFQNQRTEHMIKNRFYSLIIKCKKSHPELQSEDLLIKQIFLNLGIGNDLQLSESEISIRKKLRPRKAQTSAFESENDCQESQIAVEEGEEKLESESGVKDGQMKGMEMIVPQFYPLQFLKIESLGSLQSPSPTYVTPLQFMSYPQIFPNYTYMQYRVNTFN